MMTPIHILCENFTEIGRWKVGEMMCCLGKMHFFRPHFASI